MKIYTHSSIHDVVHMSLRHIYLKRILKPIYLTPDLHLWRETYIYKKSQIQKVEYMYLNLFIIVGLLCLVWDGYD